MKTFGHEWMKELYSITDSLDELEADFIPRCPERLEVRKMELDVENFTLYITEEIRTTFREKIGTITYLEWWNKN